VKTKTALVTGSSSGIGLAITHTLITLGYHVYGLSRSPQPEHKNFIAIECDITDTPKLTQKLDELVKITDISLLIHSAGIGKFEPHEELNAQQIQSIINTNLTAPLIITSALLRSLKKTKGTIISITSIEAIKASKFSAVYSASKAGLRQFSLALFEEVRKSGVKVISINPDMTQTPFFDDLHFEPAQDEQMHLKSEDIAKAVEDILSMRQGSLITDITIRPQKVGITKKPKN
jgi:short-subunit dehydrogenase